jgi:hypothetical protein
VILADAFVSACRIESCHAVFRTVLRADRHVCRQADGESGVRRGRFRAAVGCRSEPTVAGRRHACDGDHGVVRLSRDPRMNAFAGAGPAPAVICRSGREIDDEGVE